MKRISPLLVLLVLLATMPLARAQDLFSETVLNGFTYRNLGPFRAGAWVSDIAVPEAPLKEHLYTFYVAARTGGVWKTTNNGTTFEPIFDNQNVISIGAIAIAPSSADTVWVGTGDASNARSAYWGDGVYKSTDAGKTWQHLGLTDTQHIARIVIHPRNADIVFVAAMGHQFSRNEERGVFKTVDGGKTWKKVLYFDDTTGAIDLVMNRSNPNILYAAMYQRLRYPWVYTEGGPGSAVYKTIDGGVTWHKLGGGFPEGKIGRIGLDIYQKNPNILYAVLENFNPRAPGEPPAQGEGARKAAPQAGPVGGEVYRTDDGGQTWRKVNSERDDPTRKSGYAFDQIRVDPNNPEAIFVTGSNMTSSTDGGKTWSGLGQGAPGATRVFSRAFGDFRTLWIDPQNSERMIAGSDGGIAISYDGGKTCDAYTNLPLGEFYAVAVDMENPYNLYGGLQDHESWKGPSNGWSGSVGIEDWTTVGTGDGMYNQVDPNDSRWVYNTQEFGQLGRYDQKTRTRLRVAPSRPAGQPSLRFNWVAPARLSPHNSQIIYAGAQVLFRSLDRGDHWQEVSPDLTTNDPGKVSPPGGTIQFCTITTISESPLSAGLIWVGTDDGKVQVTRDGGGHWTDATAAIVAAGAPEDAWVTRVFASNFQPGAAYVTKSRLRQDDFRPFVYKTTDFGTTWTAISSNLPQRSVNVIVEDAGNADLLFLGNDLGVYVSNDGGQRWAPLKGNMPNVPATDIAIHPREGDLVAGTFGRGIWVTDVTPLREMTGEVLNQDAHLFAVKPKARRTEGAQGNYRLYGNRYTVTPNEPNGLTLAYYLKNKVDGTVTIEVADPAGIVVRKFEGTTKVGMNRVVWSFGFGGGGAGRGAAAGGGGRGAAAGGGGRGAAAGGGAGAIPGDYMVTLHIGDKKLTQKARVLEAAPSGNY